MTRKPAQRANKPSLNRQKTGKPAGKRGGRRRTSFGPGQSGNLKGRPPLPTDYKTAMHDRLGPKGLSCLEAILDKPAHPRHEQCAEYVVNRWKGTPTVKTEVSGPDGGPVAVKTVLTSGEKRARVAALIATVKARAAAGAPSGQDDPGRSD